MKRSLGQEKQVEIVQLHVAERLDSRPSQKVRLNETERRRRLRGETDPRETHNLASA